MDNQTPYLKTLNLPDGLHDLTNAELERLATEVRTRILDVCSTNGGHLAPSLGTVELTLALLSELDMNKDQLIWDVGHQSYSFKILTGRAEAFSTLRKKDGLAGFPRRAESPYDVFGVGHSSTSISAALGFAAARDLSGLDHHVVAVIGDGALTGGEAFEGLNLAGHQGRRLIVILNDNEMSIAPNVGALSRFLSRTLTRRWFRQTRKDVLSFLRTIPRVGGKLAVYAERGEWSFKSFFTPGMLFEAFRFAYIGPVDGHDIPTLRQHLERALAVEDGPVLLHVRTQKGHGFQAAEEDPTHYHGVGHFVPETGKLIPSKSGVPSFTKIFGQELVRLGMIERPEEISKYYFHGSGHYIGLYTHDVGNDDAPLEENMMFTLEPGLYFDELQLGIRIEDTLLVTRDGCEVLTASIPKTVEEIEAFMQANGKACAMP